MRLKRFVITLFVCVGIIGVVFAILVWPTQIVSDFSLREYSSKIYDRSENLLKIIPLDEGLLRGFVEVKTLSPTVKKIFLKSEDSRFYYHFGFDPISLGRSVFSYIKTKSILSGASTISMQSARILTNRKNRTIFDKIEEIANAIKLEFWFTKDQILTFYLSNIPFGNNIEGIESASKLFFKSSINSLTAVELSLLAIIPRSPRGYSPIDNPNKLSLQMSNLLNRCGIEFQPQDIDEAINEAAKNLKAKRYFVELPHFCLAVESKILGVDKSLLRVGASIITTIDLPLSLMLNNSICLALNKRGSARLTNGAAIVTEVKTGNVVAYVGSADFFDEKSFGQNDGVKAYNQPGSTLKPFLYQYALEHGYTLASVLPDVPITFGKFESYRPLNFDNRFSGPVRIREALASSLNVPAVYLLNEMGVMNFANRLISLGFNSLQEQKAYFGVGLVLGNSEVSLEELTKSYATLANGGKALELAYIDKIKLPRKGTKQQQENIAILTNRAKARQILDRDSSYAIVDALSEHSHRAKGFGTNAVGFPSRQLMLKSGTSDQFNNIWAVAATPSYACGVWMGNFSGSTVGGDTGSGLPSKVAVNLLELLTKPNDYFPKPQDYEIQAVCYLSGMTPNKHCKHHIYEMVPKATKLGVCSFHQNDELKLPAIYDYWALSKGVSHTVQQEQKLHIFEPIDNAVFYCDPLYNKERVEFLVIVHGGENHRYTLFLDEKPVYKGGGSIKLLCKAGKGAHRLFLKSEDEIIDSITIFVK